MTLDQLAKIQPGKTFRTGLKDLADKGDTDLLQINDINANRLDTPDQWIKVNSGSGDQKFWLKQGDILLPTRGNQYTAHILNMTPVRPAMATNQITLIRPFEHDINPYYLAWYLSTPEVTRYFNSVITGTNIKMLNANIIAKIPLSLPTKENQMRIGAIHQNWLKQKQVYQQLVETNETLYNGVCTKLQSGQPLST